MCIISFHQGNHPTYKLIVAANRDEFYNRPTAAANWWEDHPQLLAGRDLRAGGTWMALTKDGRFAALTNYRDMANEHPNRQTRGEIVPSFVLGDDTPEAFLEKLHQNRAQYNGFNVLVGSVDKLMYYANRQGEITSVPPGTHTVSNAFLNTPWPKVDRARKMLAEYVHSVDIVDVDVLFEQLALVERAPDDLLPNTGVPQELERALSSIFIETDRYGTRASTILLVTHDNDVTFIERTFERGKFKNDVTFTFTLED